MWTKNNRKYCILIGIVLIIGITIGIIFTFKINKSTYKIIANNLKEWKGSINSFHFNNIFPHLLILILLLVLSSYIIGLPLNIFYIFYNGFNIGFIISSLTKVFGFKGFIFSIIYILIIKGIFIFLFILLMYFYFELGEKITLKFIKKDFHLNGRIGYIIKKCLIIIIIIFINDLIVYTFAGKLLNIFKFLLI